MNPVPLGLLQMLGTAASSMVRPQSNPNVEGVSFEELLELAKSGDVATQQGVSIEPGVGVELTDEQSDRLAKAADRALASGASDVVVLLDGMALRMDVHSRQVTALVDLEQQSELIGIDGLISAAPHSDVSGAAAGPGRGATPMSQSLNQILSQIRTAS